MKQFNVTRGADCNFVEDVSSASRDASSYSICGRIIGFHPRPQFAAAMVLLLGDSLQPLKSVCQLLVYSELRAWQHLVFVWLFRSRHRRQIQRYYKAHRIVIDLLQHMRIAHMTSPASSPNLPCTLLRLASLSKAPTRQSFHQKLHHPRLRERAIRSLAMTPHNDLECLLDAAARRPASPAPLVEPSTQQHELLTR